MSNRSVTYSLYLNSTVREHLIQTESAAKSLDSVMLSLNNTLRMFGLGFAGAMVISAAKDAVQGAADFENALIRIKNAAADVNTGISDQFFIGSIVDKFKLDLQDSYDSYAKFLFKIKNANLSHDTKNTIFEEITAIGKVGGLTNQQLESTVFQLSTLLGEGVLEARHLRQLSMVHPQLMPFIADVMGLKGGEKDDFSKALGGDDDATAVQKLSLLMSSTKLTKMGLSSTEILPEAIKRYYENTVTPERLSESLHSVQSELNELHNKWLSFKNDFVLEHKGDLVEFFGVLKDTIKFIADNRGEIIDIAKSLLDVAISYQGFKLFNAASAMWNGIGVGTAATSVGGAVASTGMTESIVAQTESITAENVALAEATVQMDLFTQAQAAGSFGLQEFNLELNALTEKLNYQALTLPEFFAELELLEARFAANWEVAVSQSINQTSLFTDSVLSSMEQITSANVIAAEESETAWATAFANMTAASQASVDAQLMGAEARGVGSAASSMGAIYGTYGSGIASVLGRGIQAVFIAGMAESIYQSMFGGSVGGHKVGLMDIYANSKWDSSPAALFDHYYGKDKLGGYYPWFNKEERANYDYLQSLRKQNPYLNEDYFDENGNFRSDNQSRIDKLKSTAASPNFNVNSWYDPGGDPSDENHPHHKSIIPKLKKQSEHIRGNTVTNITINIHEMNGIKTGTISSKDAESKMPYQMLNSLTRVVNQSQIVK